MNNSDPKKTPAPDSPIPAAQPEIVAPNQKQQEAEVPAAPQQPKQQE